MLIIFISMLGISFGLMILLSACGTTLSKEEAYAIALKDAGVTEQDVVLQKETVDYICDVIMEVVKE